MVVVVWKRRAESVSRRKWSVVSDVAEMSGAMEVTQRSHC